MKLILLLLTLMILNPDMAYTQSSVKNVVKQLKKTERYEGFSVPGWLIRLGTRLIPSDQLDAETKGILDIAKGIKHIRVATTKLDISKYNTAAIVKNFTKKFKNEDSFEEYVSVRSEDNNLNILVKEDGDVISHLLIMSEDKGEISFIHLKTDLTPEDLRKVSFSQIKGETKQLKSNIKSI